MANFTLTWTPNINPGVSNQQAEYRQKSVGGAFLSTGFSPANPLSTSANTASITGLLDNTIYEFRISNFCIEGRTYHSNVEAIKFTCPILSEVHGSSYIVATASGLSPDIYKVRFTLYASDGTTILQGPIAVSTFSSGSCDNTFSGLTSETSYIIKIELTAIVNGEEVISALNTCQISVTTNAPADSFLINGSDSLLVNGSDTLTI